MNSPINKILNQSAMRASSLSPNQLVQDLYQAVFPVIHAHLLEQQAHDPTTGGGLQLMYHTHTAATELIREGIKAVTSAVEQVKRPPVSNHL